MDGKNSGYSKMSYPASLSKCLQCLRQPLFLLSADFFFVSRRSEDIVFHFLILYMSLIEFSFDIFSPFILSANLYVLLICCDCPKIRIETKIKFDKCVTISKVEIWDVTWAPWGKHGRFSLLWEKQVHSRLFPSSLRPSMSHNLCPVLTQAIANIDGSVMLSVYETSGAR